MFAGMATNVVFGLLRVSVLVAAVRAAGGDRIGDYDVASTITYVWLGQGLLAFVDLWGDTAFAERVRSGDVVVDLYRPWNLQAALMAGDIGRAGYTALSRLVPPVAVGALFFPFRWPSWEALPLFAVSACTAVLVSFGMRFLINSTAFWLVDNRGVQGLYAIGSGLLCGLVMPLGFFPDWARTLLWWTPFPAILQSPIDVFLEHGSAWLVIGHQVLWAVLLFLLGRLVFSRAVRKVVVQGG